MGTLRFSPQGEKVNKNTHLDVLENTYKVDCHKFYGVGGKFIFMRDGAGPHRAKGIMAWLEANFAEFWASGAWPASSPDLNLLDFFV